MESNQRLQPSTPLFYRFSSRGLSSATMPPSSSLCTNLPGSSAYDEPPCSSLYDKPSGNSACAEACSISVREDSPCSCAFPKLESSSAPLPGCGEPCSALAFCLRRLRKYTSNAPIKKINTPNETPTPMPILAPSSSLPEGASADAVTVILGTFGAVLVPIPLRPD